ncbi:MAG: hypothetical protein AAFY71_20655 [Bacteroidota bacterium]
MKLFSTGILLIVMLLLSTSCLRENQNMNCDEVGFMWPDLALCACCGGYFLEVNGDTFRVDEAPQALLDSLFSKGDRTEVNVGYESKDVFCGMDRVDILCGETIN